MGMKPVKNRNRALFEEVGAETPAQMPARPQGGMIDARPKGARGAVRLWMASLVLLALVMLGFDRLPLPEPLSAAAPFTGAAVLGIWALGALGLALGRKFPRGWAGRSLGLGALCVLAFASDPAFFESVANVLHGDSEVSAGAFQAAQGLPEHPTFPASPLSQTPAAPAEAPGGLDQIRLQAAQAADLAATEIARIGERIGVPVLQALRAGLALLLSGLAFWYAALLGRSEAELISARRQGEPRLTGLASGMMHLGFVQLLLGALVSSLGAGAVYMDWPLMGGSWFPADGLILEPLWRNFIENPGLVQFLHRVVGYLLLVLGIVAFLRARRSVHGATRAAFAIATIWLFVLVGLGILTLLRGDSEPIALTHLGVAVALWFFVIRARFFARYPRVQSIRRS